MICYSFVGALLREGPALNADQVINIASRTPIARIRSLSSLDAAASGLVDEVLSEYEWFLKSMNHKKEKVLDWIADEEIRIAAFARSKTFINAMYRLTLNIAERHGYTRYLVI
jgi:hypothetical protein